MLFWIWGDFKLVLNAYSQAFLDQVLTSRSGIKLSIYTASAKPEFADERAFKSVLQFL